MRVVVVDVGRQDSFEVSAVEDQEPIEALAADAADPNAPRSRSPGVREPVSG
jgi:hypothetical protein